VNCAEFVVDWRIICSVAFALVAFGAAYNSLMDRLRNKSGYVSIFVAGGVLVTLVGVAIISWQAALLALGAFACSGLPMIAGSMYRYMRATEEARRNLARIMGSDDETAA
jgi:hypothetical protein